MFNVSKQTLWFAIALISLIFIYLMTDFNNLNMCSSYNTPVINKEIETSVIIRRKLNNRHNKIKQIHRSPKNKSPHISIKSLKNKLQKKISKTTTISKTTKPKINIKLYFADWCPHCVDFKPIWNKLKLTHGNLYNFEDIDCTNYNPNLPFVTGLPTISVFDSNNNHIENYELDRTFNAVESYLKKF